MRQTSCEQISIESLKSDRIELPQNNVATEPIAHFLCNDHTDMPWVKDTKGRHLGVMRSGAHTQEHSRSNGKIGRCLYVDQSEQGFDVDSLSGMLFPQHAFTLSLWVNMSFSVLPGELNVFDTWSWDRSHLFMRFVYQSSVNNRYLQVTMHPKAALSYDWNMGIPMGILNDNVWNHIAVVWQKGIFVRLYINHVLENERSIISDDVSPVGQLFRIFGGHIGQGCFIDDIQLYDRVLSTGEIENMAISA